MHTSSLFGKKARVLFICLLSILMLTALCLTAGAIKDEQIVFTLDPAQLNSVTGSDANFSWAPANSNCSLKAVTTTGYSDKVISIKRTSFTITDTKGCLENHEAVVISADLYFAAFPDGNTVASNNTTCNPDITSVPFQTQSILAWLGTNYDGLRIDCYGNLYSGSSLETALGAKLTEKTWHNLMLVFSKVSNRAELWLDGKFISTLGCSIPDESKAVRFFDGRFPFEAYVKNVKFSVSDVEYYTGIVKENSADFLSYQTTKPDANGNFKLRIISGVNDLYYENFGYRVIVLTKDAEGNMVANELTGTDTRAYSSFFGGNTKYSVKTLFDYQYACLATVENLKASSDFTELIIYPYTVSATNGKIYGTPISLVYTGNLDDEGYPLLAQNETTQKTLTPTDDTFITKLDKNTPKGSLSKLDVRNIVSEANDTMYRAAYFKFTIPKETVDRLDLMANIRLHINTYFESNQDRTRDDLAVYASTTDWDEETLTYNKHVDENVAVRGSTPIDTVPGEMCSGAISFDLLDYIKDLAKTAKNNDGSLTVAFCVTQKDGYTNPLLSYIYSKESGESTDPYLSFEESLYGHSIRNVKSANVGHEPLAYAEKLVDEWFEVLYPALYLDENGKPFYHDELGEFNPNGYAANTATGDYTVALDWKNGIAWHSTPTQNPLSEFIVQDSSWSSDRFARTLSTLGTSTANAYLNSDYAKETTEYDAYGGITNLDFKGTATGFFHTEKNPADGRTYVIDPLGYPYFASSINTVGYGTGDTANQRTYIDAAYGDKKTFFNEISSELRSLGVNTAFTSSSSDLLAVEENGLAVTVGAIGIGSYMAKLGRSQVSEGIFPNNNTINVFDPDLAPYLMQKNEELILKNGYATMDKLFAYTTDNELPSGETILERYLTIDPMVPENSFSYQTAWAWLARKMNTPNPTLDALHSLSAEEYAAYNSEFLGFVYAMYYKATSEAIRAADKNHMYIGSRVNGNCPYTEGYLRAAGYYLDIISINLYGGLNPKQTTVANIYKYSGKPFIVTEFFAKGYDTIDANGYQLATSTGAGIFVHTQEDRATYYEHYVLNLLDTNACVGWVWYRFRDNDQSLYTVIGKDGTVYENVIFLSTTHGEKPHPNSLMTEDGHVYWLDFFYDGPAANWDTATYGTGADAPLIFTKTYSGEALASNQNINKGYYNNNFSSVVTVYSYKADGTLDRFPAGDDLYTFGSRSYEVQHPESAYLADGTVLTSTDGETTFTLGTKTNADGSYTVTKLTVYKGRYITLTDTVKKMSDNLVGLIKYLDNN